MGLFDSMNQFEQSSKPQQSPPSKPYGEASRLALSSNASQEQNNNPWTAVSNWSAQMGSGIRTQFEALSDKIQGVDTNDPEAGQPSIYDEMNEVFNMPFWQRAVACVLGLAAGFSLIFISLMFLPVILIRPSKFALSFTLGNVVCLGSVVFLVGPSALVSAATDPIRATTAIVYFGSLLSTLIFAFFAKHAKYILVLISVIVEVVSLAWYTLSFIPYFQTLLPMLFNAGVAQTA